MCSSQSSLQRWWQQGRGRPHPGCRSRRWGGDDSSLAVRRRVVACLARHPLDTPRDARLPLTRPRPPRPLVRCHPQLPGGAGGSSAGRRRRPAGGAHRRIQHPSWHAACHRWAAAAVLHQSVFWARNRGPAWQNEGRFGRQQAGGSAGSQAASAGWLHPPARHLLQTLPRCAAVPLSRLVPAPPDPPPPAPRQAPSCLPPSKVRRGTTPSAGTFLERLEGDPAFRRWFQANGEGPGPACGCGWSLQGNCGCGWLLPVGPAGRRRG